MIFLKVGLVALAGLFWRGGGSASFPKGMRRYGVPILIAVNTLFVRNWVGLAALPLMFGAASLGYGVNSNLMKVFKNKYVVRAICGLAYALSAIPIFIGNWWALGYHVLVLTTGITLAGTQKFKGQNAVWEETFVGILFSLMPIFG